MNHESPQTWTQATRFFKLFLTLFLLTSAAGYVAGGELNRSLVYVTVFGLLTAALIMHWFEDRHWG